MRALRQSGEMRYNGCYLGIKEIGGDEVDMGQCVRENNVEQQDDDMQVDSTSEQQQMVQIRTENPQQSSSRLPTARSSFALSSGIETLQPRRTDSPFRVQAANNARKQGQKMEQTPPEFSFGTVQPSQALHGQQQQQQPQQGQGGLRQSQSMRFMGMFADALVSVFPSRVGNTRIRRLTGPGSSVWEMITSVVCVCMHNSFAI